MIDKASVRGLDREWSLFVKLRFSGGGLFRKEGAYLE